MPFEVLLAEDAERDIEDIHAYIFEADGTARADGIIDDLEALCLNLAKLPERGNTPKELRNLGITEYREVHDKPYRVIYRIFESRVIVYAVLDGRRDMESLLQRRLLR